MTKFQHTQNPWDVFTTSAAHQVRDAIRSERICTINTSVTDQLAKARLIAAAPDLLAALENLLEDALRLGLADSDMSGSAIEARAAIAKAKEAYCSADI